jgi:hypothetical protein
MGEHQSSMTYSEPDGLPEDCFEHIARHDISEGFKNRANGDDAGFVEYVENEWEEIDEEDA